MSSEEEHTGLPRSQARFIIDSAKWVMALLGTIFVTILAGGGYMITLQMTTASTMADMRVQLDAHTRQLRLFEAEKEKQQEIFQKQMNNFNERLILHDTKNGNCKK